MAVGSLCTACEAIRKRRNPPPGHIFKKEALTEPAFVGYIFCIISPGASVAGREAGSLESASAFYRHPPRCPFRVLVPPGVDRLRRDVSQTPKLVNLPYTKGDQ